MQHHKYSLTELENMIPWEKDIYVNMLMRYLEEESERLKARYKNKRDNIWQLKNQRQEGYLR
jgi:hypothetical protein